MTNNNPLVNALTQINSANRNKQLLLIFGSLTVIGMIGFGVTYLKFRNTKTDAKSYREKLLKANQTISMFLANAEKEKEKITRTLETETKDEA